MHSLPGPGSAAFDLTPSRIIAWLVPLLLAVTCYRNHY